MTSNGAVQAAHEELHETAKAIVIGSGFGGAVTACRLSQAGYEPIVLERGRRYGPDDFPPLPNDSELFPDSRQWTWQSEQGLWDVVDLHEIIAVQVAGYGGGSLLYANVHLRPPRSVFDTRWPQVYQEGALDEFYDLAAYTLDAAPISEHSGLRHIVKVDQLRQAANQLGRRDAFFSPPLAISTKQGPNRFGRHQNACTGCGGCCSGCREQAKNTLDFNYLAIAESNGAKIRTQCEVTDIVQGITEEARWTVRCVDHLLGATRSFSAPHLFLCAGSIHSTRLLAGVTLLKDPFKVKERVGVGYFPGGDAIGVIYDTAHVQRPSVGPAISTATVHWNLESSQHGPEKPNGSSSFFLIQDGGYADQLARLIGAFRAPIWVGRNRLTNSGNATIGQSEGLSVPLDSNRSLATHGDQGVLPALFDSALDAMMHGDGRGIVPKQIRDNIPGLLDEVRDAMLLPEIVERTIDGALRDGIRKFLQGSWLGQWFLWCFPEEGAVMRSIRRFLRRLIDERLGTDQELANRALRALLTASGMPRTEVASRLLGYDKTNEQRRAMLLAMGRDAASGVLHYDARRKCLIADLDLFALAPGYTRQERLMMDFARQLGGELRTSPAWAFLGKPITVHNQGGCPMSKEPLEGVTTPDGEVHGCPGLYVLDGAALCTSVGVNPSATIAAIAERNILGFIEGHGKLNAESWREYEEQRRQAEKWKKTAEDRGWRLSPPDSKIAAPVEFKSEPLGIELSEHMEGYWSEGGRPRNDAGYRELETRGRPDHLLRLDLRLKIADLTTFFDDPRHHVELTGDIECWLPDDPRYRGEVKGRLQLFAPVYKPYGIREEHRTRRRAQERLAGSYRTRLIGSDRAGSKADERRMLYGLKLIGTRFVLSGYKRMKNDPGLDAWRDTASLFVRIIECASQPKTFATRGGGLVHVDAAGFLFDQIPSLTVTGTEDPARIVWAAASFSSFFFGTLQRIYMPQTGSMLETLFTPHWAGAQRHPFSRGR